jgi:hypothetical protein
MRKIIDRGLNPDMQDRMAPAMMLAAQPGHSIYNKYTWQGSIREEIEVGSKMLDAKMLRVVMLNRVMHANTMVHKT